jgi:hypothetical protein
MSLYTIVKLKSQINERENKTFGHTGYNIRHGAWPSKEKWGQQTAMAGAHVLVGSAVAYGRRTSTSTKQRRKPGRCTGKGRPGVGGGVRTRVVLVPCFFRCHATPRRGVIRSASASARRGGRRSQGMQSPSSGLIGRRLAHPDADPSPQSAGQPARQQ